MSGRIPQSAFVQSGSLAVKVLLAVFGAALLVAVTLYSKREHIVIGAEAYVFGYPLVIMDVTRANAQLTYGPGNELHHFRKFPDADFKEIVRANVDTLYTNAFIDMAKGPWVFEMPANDKRFTLMQFMDAWTNVFAGPGWRTEGKSGGKYLLVGPGWQGEPPAGLKVLRSPTNLVWLLGRIQTNGATDYPVVHSLQDAIQLHSLADWQAGRATDVKTQPPVGLKPLPPIAQMQQMAAEIFFDRLMALMVVNPPPADDGPMAEKLGRIGLVPGQSPRWSLLEQWSVALGVTIAQREIDKELKKSRETVNGWSMPPKNLGRYGTDYGFRTVIAMIGLGANLPSDAVYPTAKVDGSGQPLTGAYRYVLHFDAAQLPPVKAFWSVTAYGEDSFLIANSINRYALGDRDPLKFNSDGSLDLYIQAKDPGDAKRNNWLPLNANGAFNISARLYWPSRDVLEGKWTMPPIDRVD